MYAFYSLLVYIFYTVFKKEEEEEGALEVCVDTFKSGVGGSCWSGRSNSIHFYFICTRLGPFKNQMVFKEAACIYHAFIQHWIARVLLCVLPVSAALWDLQCEGKYFHHVSLSRAHAISRSQHMFPWQQSVGGEMATPPRRRSRLVLSLAIPVSAPLLLYLLCDIVFVILYGKT